MNRRLSVVVMLIIAGAPALAQTKDAQRQVDSSLAPANQHGFRTATRTIELTADIYTLRAPLRIQNAWGLTIRGSGPQTVLEADFDAPNGAAVELVGSNYCQLEGLTIRPAAGRSVGFGLLVARKPAAAPPSAGNHFFSRVFIEGSYRHACAANIASECNLWQHCYFMQTGPGAALLITNGGLPEIGVPHGVSTMLEASWQDCLFSSSAESARQPLVRIVKNDVGIVGDLNFRGGGMSCAAPLPVAVLLEALGKPGQVQDIHFDGMRWETEPALHAIGAVALTGTDERKAAEPTAGGAEPGPRGRPFPHAFTRISIRDCTITSSQEAIFAPGQILADWVASNLNLYVANKTEFYKRPRRAAVVAQDVIGDTFRLPTGKAAHLFTDFRQP